MSKNREQNCAAAVNPAVGIGVPDYEAHSLASCRGFFVRSTRQVLRAGRVERGNPRRPSYRYANLHGLPTSIGVGVGGDGNRFTRTTDMATKATDAPTARTLQEINPLIEDNCWNLDTACNIRCAIEFLADAIPAVMRDGVSNDSRHGIHILLRAVAAAVETCHA